MCRTCLSIVAFVLAIASCQETQRSTPGCKLGAPLYTYKRADYCSDLAAAKNAAQRLEVLRSRWKAIKLAVAHAHVVTDRAFHTSMAFWTSKYLSTGRWTVSADGDLTKAVREDGEATVLVHGDCLQRVSVTKGALIHVLGDLSAEISVHFLLPVSL